MEAFKNFASILYFSYTNDSSISYVYSDIETGWNGSHVVIVIRLIFKGDVFSSWGLISLDLTKLFVEQQITCFNWTIEH